MINKTSQFISTETEPGNGILFNWGKKVMDFCVPETIIFLSIVLFWWLDGGVYKEKQSFCLMSVVGPL